MARLIYSAIMSLDGYIADAEGYFEWAAPDEEVFSFANDLERPVGTYLYGRRMYETMRYWETAHTLEGQSAAERDFTQLWQGADKIVYSTTLREPDTARTRIERDFDPDQARTLKETAGRDLTAGGAHLAAQAIAAGLAEPDREEVADGRLRRYYRLTDDGAAELAAETERRRASAAVAAQRLTARLAVASLIVPAK